MPPPLRRSELGRPLEDLAGQTGDGSPQLLHTPIPEEVRSFARLVVVPFYV